MEGLSSRPSGKCLIVTNEPSAQPSPYPADTSLQSILDDLAAQGYSGTFTVDADDGNVACTACNTSSPAASVRFEQRRRIEGASDPAEMSNVLAVRCPQCAEPGTIICRYGPEAGIGDSAILEAARGQIND